MADVRQQEMKSKRQTSQHIETRPQAGLDDIEAAAFDLLCVFMADKPVQQLLGKYAYNGIAYCFDSRKEEYILRRLIEIATFYRLHYWALDTEKKIKEKSRNVGVLFDDQSDNAADLTLHEACNKIIHAEKITFEVRKVPKAPFHYLNQWVVAEGKKSGKTWTAMIQVILFCDEVLSAPHPDDLPF